MNYGHTDDDDKLCPLPWFIDDDMDYGPRLAYHPIRGGVSIVPEDRRHLEFILRCVNATITGET